MLIESLTVNRLQPAPYNPRMTLKPGDKAWEKLERSLEEFELVQPIVWNRQTGHVVSGHQRLAVLKHRGVSSVECVVVDLSLDQEKALNITLNNASVGSDWDPGKLVDLVEELQALPEFDATLTGFDEQQLKDLVLTPELGMKEPASDDGDFDDGIVRVTLEVPDEDWETVRRQLDTLLAELASLRIHLHS